MILKKPYAFLIKHFKVIHLVITILLCLVIYQGYNIYNFFSVYIRNNYSTSITLGLASKYIPITLYIEILLILFFVITIIVLLLHKKKPSKIYLLMSIYYVLYIIYLFYLTRVFNNFEYALLESTTARIIRDITLMVLTVQVIFIVYMLLRTLGFNVRQFNFAKDYKELQLSDSDAAEVEININFETYKLKRNIKRFAREMVYYVKENKFIVSVIGVILLVLGLYFIYDKTSSNYDKTYKAGNVFVYNNLSITVGDSIISDLNYRGNVIEQGKYYLALKLKINNIYKNPINFDYNSLKLVVGDKTLVPKNNYINNFLDYNSTVLPNTYIPNEEREVMVIYELDSSLINEKMKLKIYNGSVIKDGNQYIKNIYINIKPKLIGEPRIAGNYNLDDILKFNDTFLRNTTLEAYTIDVSKNYVYNYKDCNSNGECQSYKDMITTSVVGGRDSDYIMVINADLLLDDKTSYGKAFNSYYFFAENFMSIQYRVDDRIVSDAAINVTPNVQGINFFAFQVPKEITSADVVQAIISIRDCRYIINIKA